MFEKFGELNSFGEINELAENLFNEGDTESLRAMAKENGIQSDFVDMYLQGEIPALCDQLTAALGKIDVEVAELKPKEIMEDWVESIREVDFSGLKVPFVAVYGHPDDFPDKYVARIYELDRATDTIMVKETLEEIEMDIKEHTAMTFIPRGTADVPSLVGVWM